ncbi:MAG: CRISPR-associated protein Cas4 [Chloroflexi bacterium]|nr:CRISPR-associated protein Cas4 [Chloroflexota bacterium]
MDSLLLAAAVLLFIAALVIFRSAGKQRQLSGLPSGRIIYSDTDRWKKVEKPLYDPVYGLTGKPDYLVEDRGAIIPVEVKSSRAPSLPYDSHVFQLAAYCLLVEQAYGERPPYGILRYRDRTFSIDYTPELEQELHALLKEIRGEERQDEVDRSHHEPARCARCGYRSICDQRL